MRRTSLLALPLLVFATLAQAGVQLVVRGVDEPLQQAISASVGLSQYAHRDVSDAQMRRLYAQAPAQARAALEPYGYYDADVAPQLQQVGKDWKVTLDVRTGEPVKVATVVVQLDAEALALPSIRHARGALTRMRGKQLDHAGYDAARDALSAALTASGFLDAKLTTHRVEVDTAQRSAAQRSSWHGRWAGAIAMARCASKVRSSTRASWNATFRSSPATTSTRISCCNCSRR